MERRQASRHRYARSKSCRELGSDECSAITTSCGNYTWRQDLGSGNPDKRCGGRWRIRMHRSTIKESHTTLGAFSPYPCNLVFSKIAIQTSGVTVTLTRDLHLSTSFLAGRSPPNISDVTTQVEFRGPEYSVPPGVEGIARLVIDIPRHSRGVKGGLRVDNNGRTTEGFFEVRCALKLRIDMSPEKCAIHDFVFTSYQLSPVRILS